MAVEPVAVVEPSTVDELVTAAAAKAVETAPEKVPAA